MPDTVDTMIWVPDDGWRYHPKHVEQFTDINKLYIVASCWIIIDTNMTLFRDVCSKIKNKNFYQKMHPQCEENFNIYVDNKTAVWNCGTFFICGGDAVNQGPYAATGTEGWWRCCSDTLAASALEICGCSTSGSGSFIPRKTGVQRIGGWVSPSASLHSTQNPSPSGKRFPDRLSRSGSLYRLSCLQWRTL